MITLKQEHILRQLIAVNDWILPNTHIDNFTQAELWAINSSYAEVGPDGYGMRWTGKIAYV